MSHWDVSKYIIQICHFEKNHFHTKQNKFKFRWQSNAILLMCMIEPYAFKIINVYARFKRGIMFNVMTSIKAISNYSAQCLHWITRGVLWKIQHRSKTVLVWSIAEYSQTDIEWNMEHGTCLSTRNCWILKSDALLWIRDTRVLRRHFIKFSVNLVHGILLEIDSRHSDQSRSSYKNIGNWELWRKRMYCILQFETLFVR